MIILDVETTGTNPDWHSLVSIGALDFDKPEERFYEECRIWDGAHVDPAALEVNGYSQADIKDSTKKSEGEIVANFLRWLLGRAEILIGGQNPFFDTGFVEAAAHRNHLNFTLAHRIIDLHTICFFHMVRRGRTAPMKNKKSDINSDFIMNYVGIPAEPKPHIAINGALWEAEAFSRFLHERPLFEQFKKYKIPWL